MSNQLTRPELAIVRTLRSAERIQRFLDEQIGYHKQPTCRSVRRVLRDRVGHCMEGALFAAAALKVQGHPPLLLDLEAVNDDDHVLAVYRMHNAWGAIAKSNYAGLRFREPVYRTIRELVLSYFEHYFNLRAQKTLRAYSRPVNLSRFDRACWMTAEEDVWAVPQHLCEIRHYPILTPDMERNLAKMDRRLFQAGQLGVAK